MPENTDRTALGCDANVAAALAYVLGWISGVVVLASERQNRFVRFHALQSILVFGGLSLAWFLCLSLPFGWLISFIVLPPISAVLWLILMFKAYKGQRMKLPYVGDVAEAHS